MKTIFHALFIIVFICSCNADINKETVNQDSDQQSKPNLKESSKLESLIKEKDDSFSNLIGKNTVEIEIMGWYNCAGEVLDSPVGTISHAVSQLAKSQEECRNGRGKVVLEKLLYRNNGKPIHEVIDEINIESNYPEQEYSWTTCKINGAKSEEFYIIQFKDQRQAELTKIQNLWTVDLKVGKFIKVKNPNDVICINPDYSDGL